MNLFSGLWAYIHPPPVKRTVWLKETDSRSSSNTNEVTFESLNEQSLIEASSNHWSLKIKYIPSISSVPSRLKLDTGDCFYFQFDRKFNHLLQWFADAIGKRNISQTRGRVTGPIGCGKTYLLAALFHFVTRRNKLESNTPPYIIYISSCALLLRSSDPIDFFTSAMVLAFDSAWSKAIKKLDSWTKIGEFLLKQSKPCNIIALILDDFNAVTDVKESETRQVQTRDGLEYVSSCVRFVIEGLSSRVDQITDKPPMYYKGSFVVDSGLDDEAWAAWLGHFFPNINEEDTLLLEDYTGRVPLYLRAIESSSGNTIQEKVDNFMSNPKLDDLHIEDLLRTNLKVLYDDQTKSMEAKRSMIEAIVNANYFITSGSGATVYDKRFYHLDANHRHMLVLNGTVARLMNRILLEEYQSVALDSCSTIEWSQIENSSRVNPTVKGFVFEQFALSRIALSGKSLIDDRFRSTSVKIVRFDGNFPEADLVKTVDSLVLFWPNKFNLEYVDAVIRFKSPTELKIIAIQVTLKKPIDHASTADFFMKPYSKTRSGGVSSSSNVDIENGGHFSGKSHVSKYYNESSTDLAPAAKKSKPTPPVYSLLWVCPKSKEEDDGYQEGIKWDPKRNHQADQEILFL